MMFGNWTRKENYEGALWFINNVSPFLDIKTTIKIIGRKFPIEKINNSNPLVTYEVLGFVDDPYDILSKSKCLISPLFNGAGIKVKVIESLACGTPVVTYRTGGSPEALTPETGIVVERGDVKEMADAIMTTLTKTKETIDACRQRAVSNYDKDVCFLEYAKLYSELISKH